MLSVMERERERGRERKREREREREREKERKKERKKENWREQHDRRQQRIPCETPSHGRLPGNALGKARMGTLTRKARTPAMMNPIHQAPTH